MVVACDGAMLRRLPVSEIKKIIHAAGKETHDIIEKPMLVERALSCMMMPPEPIISSTLDTGAASTVALADSLLE